MEFAKFVEWAFYAIVSGCAVLAVAILGNLKDSIQELNIKIAVIIEKQVSHEKRLDKHDEQIEELIKA